MKAKDKERLQALRGIKAVFQSAAKDKGLDALSDEECIAVLRKLSKQRQESVDAYTQVCLVTFPGHTEDGEGAFPLTHI